MDDDVRHDVLILTGGRLRKHLLERFKPDASIAATRLAIELLTQTGCPDVFGLSVRLSIFNKAMVERALVEDDGLPATPEITRQWERECGAWGIGLGYDGKSLPGRWPGHLVAIVERKWLWDLTIDQANRPEHNIIFPAPVVLKVDEEFLRGRRQLTASWNKMLLMYDAHPADKSFRQAPEWNHLQTDAVMSASNAVRRAIDAVVATKKESV